MQRKDFSVAIRSTICSSVSINTTSVWSRLHEGGKPRSPRTSQSGNSKSACDQKGKRIRTVDLVGVRIPVDGDELSARVDA